MRTVDAELRLADMAAGQWGLVTTPQATTLGVSHSQLNRLAEHGSIARLSHGVYQLRSAPPDRHVDLRVAWLALEPKRSAGQRLRSPESEAIVSHSSAAALRGWGDLTAYDSEFTFDGRKQTRRDGVRLHRGPTAHADVEIIDGLPTTTAERLITDLVGANYDLEHVGAVLAGAVRERSIDLEQLAKRLAVYTGRRGFADPTGTDLVSALIQAGGVQDEVAADSLVRLIRAESGELTAFHSMILASLQEDVQPMTARLVAASVASTKRRRGTATVVARIQAEKRT